MSELTTTRTYPTPLDEMLRRAQLDDARIAAWPSGAELADAEAAVRAELIANFLAASDQVAIDGALAEARTYDLLNLGSPPVLEELLAIRQYSAEVA